MGKKFLGNKNVVTLLGMIVIVVVLYMFYLWRVRSAVNFKDVIIAEKNIDRMTEIDRSMYKKEGIPDKALIGNVIYNESQLAGKFSGVNSYIPIGSFFYYSSANNAGNIVDKYDLPTAFLFEFDLDKDIVAYNYKVNTQVTYANSVLPGNYIDVYLRIAKSNASGDIKYTFGKLVENVKVLSVKDGSGRNVFTNTNETRTPSMIIFGVEREINKYLRTAETLIGDVEIIIVPTNVNFTDEDPANYETAMTTQELKDYLDEFVDYKEDEEETGAANEGTNVEPTESETETETSTETTVESSETITNTLPGLPKPTESTDTTEETSTEGNE